MFYNKEKRYRYGKVRKYSSFEDMKNTATSGPVSAAVLADRHKRFENFMDFLCGDNPPEKLHPKAAKQAELKDF